MSRITAWDVSLRGTGFAEVSGRDPETLRTRLLCRVTGKGESTITRTFPEAYGDAATGAMDFAIIEDGFYDPKRAQNHRTALDLATERGAVACLCELAGAVVEFESPATWRSPLSISNAAPRDAQKESAARMALWLATDPGRRRSSPAWGQLHLPHLRPGKMSCLPRESWSEGGVSIDEIEAALMLLSAGKRRGWF
jgi:hypothetical protein